MSQTRRPDFGRLAADYDRVRPVDENWREIYELVVAEAGLAGRRVLDCGCGTGRLSAALSAAGAEVVAIDAEERMLAVARTRVSPGVRLERARAEDLPFPDASFDAVVMWLVCHLVDRPVSFREARRVLDGDGCLVVVSFDASHFDRFWLNAYFPSLEQVDRSRFPTEEMLGHELDTAGFHSTRLLRRSQRASLTRAEALERIAAGHISTFDLLDAEEVRAGRERARTQLPPVVEYRLEWLLALAWR